MNQGLGTLPPESASLTAGSRQNESPWRAIRGYPKTAEGEEDRKHGGLKD